MTTFPDPPVSREMVVSFSVIVHGVDPPPDWAAKIFKGLSREVELMYGTNAVVTQLGPPGVVRSSAGDPETLARSEARIASNGGIEQ